MRTGIAALLVSLGVLTPVAALEVPRVPTSYLTDLAAAIPRAQSAAVEQRLQALERSTGHQVIAVLFPSLAGEALEDFTIRCAESWKVGNKGIDDGAIFFAFIRERRMRLEVGYGLEAKVSDAVARQVLDNVVKPAFAAGDYGSGVLALADALERVFAGESVPASQPIYRTRSERGPGFMFFLVLAVLLLKALFRGRRRYSAAGFWGGFGGSGGGWSSGGFSAGGGSFGGGGASGSW